MAKKKAKKKSTAAGKKKPVAKKLDDCYYEDKRYSHGSVICVLHKKRQCNNGTWRTLSVDC